MPNPVAMLDEETNHLVGAGPYERADERTAYRTSHYERDFTTTSSDRHAQDAETQGHALRHGDHQAPQKARDVGREGHHRDAPGGVSTRRIEDVSKVLWAPACQPARSPTSTRRHSYRSINEDAALWPANTRTSTSTAST